MPESTRLSVRTVGAADRPWVAAFFDAEGATSVARRGELMRPLDHPMLIAVVDGSPAGVVSYLVGGDACEILTLHVVDQWRGIGTALVESVRATARAAGCSSLWVLTTNDNVDALRFYQRRGFRIRVIRPAAVDEARRNLKPAIPAIGEYGIPIRDEIELVTDL